MVEVKSDLWVRTSEFLSVFHCTLSHVAKQRLVRILASTTRYLKDDGGLRFYSSADDCLELLHVVEVESRDSVATLDCLCEHLARIDETKFLVTNHIIDLFEVDIALVASLAKIR